MRDNYRVRSLVRDLILLILILELRHVANLTSLYSVIFAAVQVEAGPIKVKIVLPQTGLVTLHVRRSFGRFTLVGTHVINTIHKFLYQPVTRRDREAAAAAADKRARRKGNLAESFPRPDHNDGKGNE